MHSQPYSPLERLSLPPSVRPWRFALLVFALTVSIVWLVTISESQLVERGFKETVDAKLAALAQRLARQIDADRHAYLGSTADQDTREYQEIQAILAQAIHGEMPIAFAYTIRPTSSGFEYVVANLPAQDSRWSDPLAEERQSQSKTSGPLRPAKLTTLLEVLRTKKAVVAGEPVTEPRGAFLYGFAPILTDNDQVEGMVALAYRADDYLTLMQQMHRRGNISMALGTSLAGGIGLLIWMMLRHRFRSMDEVRRVLAALAESEDRLRLFIEHAPAAVAMFDVQMRYLAHSRRWLDEYGFHSDEQIIGRNHYELFPEIPPRWRAIHQNCLAGQVEEGTQDKLVLACGKVQWLQWEARPWYRYDGTVGGLLMFSRDISEFVEQQELVREQASRLDLAVQAANMAIWDYDIPSEYLHFGGKGLTLLGYDPNVRYLTTRQWMERIHDEDRPQVEQALSHLLAGESGDFRLEYRIRRIDASWAWIFVVGKVTSRDQAGLPLRAMGIAMDISETRQAEVALHAATADARRLASAIDAHSDAVLLADAQGHIIRVNQAFETLTGYSSQEAIGKPLGDLEHCRSHSNVYLEMWSTIRSGQPWSGRQCIRRKAQPVGGELSKWKTVYDGEHRAAQSRIYWADVSISPLLTDDGVIDGYVSVQRDVTNEVEREESLAIAARTDELTGLGNRAFLQQRLQRALGLMHRKPGYQFAVLFMDLDRFKLINDSLGHHFGDLVLQEVANRLQNVLRCTDLVLRNVSTCSAVRWGGDEFVVILDYLDAPHDVVLIVERILNALEQPYEFDGQSVQTSASIGMVYSAPQYQDADEILRDADTALYEAKNRGKACWVMFDSSMQKAVERRMQIENDLRSQIEFSQFFLSYQPIVSLGNHRLVGAEALIRWDHPTRGLICPTEFIPIAEETRTIIDLGQWVMEQACRQWLTWNQISPAQTPEYITVDLSRVQIADHQIVDRVSEVLKATGMEPQRIVFEVTESSIMQNPQAMQTTLWAIKQLGVRLAIDGFGTGYSSLACLHEFPFDILKIDRSLISNLDASPQMVGMTQAIVTLGKHLGMVCVAEGVVNKLQAATLQSIDCQLAQGYYFTRHMPPQHLLEGPWDHEEVLDEPVGLGGK